MRAFELPALIVTLVGGPLLIRAYIMHEGDGSISEASILNVQNLPNDNPDFRSIDPRLLLRESWFRDLNGYYDKYMLENVAYQKGLMTYSETRNKGYKRHWDDIHRNVNEEIKLQVQNYHYFLNPFWIIYS